MHREEPGERLSDMWRVHVYLDHHRHLYGISFHLMRPPPAMRPLHSLQVPPRVHPDLVPVPDLLKVLGEYDRVL